MQPHSLGRNVADRRIDRIDHAVAERDEIGERPIRECIVLFAREIGAIELQQEAGIDNRLVFVAQRDAERAQEFFLGLVVLVLHNRRYHAR